MNEFKQCANGHYYQGDECPSCKAAVTQAIKMMLKMGKTSDQAREYLINTCNFDIEIADSWISKISNWREEYEKADNSAMHDIAFGLLWFMVGSIVTALTYSDGGSYIVAWGAIIWGLIQLIMGLVSKLRAIHFRNHLI